MGRPDVTELTIKIKYDPDGVTEEIRYYDQEGCGVEKVIPIHTSLVDLVEFHLNHCRNSHEIHVPKLCKFEIKTDAGIMRCSLEIHDKGEHVLVVPR